MSSTNISTAEPRGSLADYQDIVGADVIDQLRQLARGLRGLKVVHVNSTRTGGGVAEILSRLVPLKQELGIDASWEVIRGTEDFFTVTKHFHNGLQGNQVSISQKLLDEYERLNRENAEELRGTLEQADIVFIHDPQPAPLLQFTPGRKGKWIWRCHIDVSRPYRPVWKYLSPFIEHYDADIWSLASFARPMNHPQYLIPPSIDPLAEKNIALSEADIDGVCNKYGIDRGRPLALQVSRFDRFKDPIGVIRSYRLAKDYIPSLQLVMAGGTASDDPEGEAVLKEVLAGAEGDPDLHILSLPPDVHREINALQRAADVVFQKSLREGFGLTVTEALWKGKPVIGGETGGIRLQIFNYRTGFLVSSPEGGALRLRYLLDNRERAQEMGARGRQLVLEHFLLTRHLREYLTLMLVLQHNAGERLELP
jgi:trehalose synthase